MMESRENRIVESWMKNAHPWSRAIRENQIESRVLVTNTAIVDVVSSINPRRVLDVGCGEGWLTKELCRRRIDAMGIDVVPELIREAERDGIGQFRTVAYDNMTTAELPIPFDAAVCNFSLLGKESVEGVVKVVPGLLSAHGTFIVQTSHPVTSCGDLEYRDGWRPGSWQGFSPEFTDPAPWYFRTMDSWISLFEENDFEVTLIKEPIHPQTGSPASVIIVGRLKGES